MRSSTHAYDTNIGAAQLGPRARGASDSARARVEWARRRHAYERAGRTELAVGAAAITGANALRRDLKTAATWRQVAEANIGFAKSAATIAILCAGSLCGNARRFVRWLVLAVRRRALQHAVASAALRVARAFATLRRKRARPARLLRRASKRNCDHKKCDEELHHAMKCSCDLTQPRYQSEKAPSKERMCNSSMTPRVRS